jgi:ferredoxin-type protein NapH
MNGAPAECRFRPAICRQKPVEHYIIFIKEIKMVDLQPPKKGLNCTQAKTMYQNIRNTTQLFAVILSAMLLGMGIYYFNILFVIAALLIAIFAGRVFCGWVCPNGAWLDHIVSRFSLDRKMPRFLTSRWFGYSFTVIFLTIFVYLRVFITDSAWVWTIPIGMMAVQITLGTILGAIYYPRGFCAHVCPWGITGSLIGRKASYQMTIHPNCKSCRTCASICPLGGLLEPAIDTVKETRMPVTVSSDCMRCMSCVGACPANALRFGPVTDPPFQQNYHPGSASSPERKQEAG